MTAPPEPPPILKPFIHSLDPAFYPMVAESYRGNDSLFRDLEKAYAGTGSQTGGLQDQLREDVLLKPCRSVIDAFLKHSPPEQGINTHKAQMEALEPLRRYARFFREVKAQIGCAGKPVNDRTRSDLKAVFDEYVSLMRPAVVLGRYSCRFEKERIFIEGMEEPISSRKLFRFYTTAWKRNEEEEYATYESERPDSTPPRECFLFAATIGPGVDREVMRLSEEGDNYRALLLNGIGAGAADMVALDLELYLNDKYPARHKRWRRFHVGYADFRLQEQKPFFELLKPERIGITLTDSCIMIPEKSVSGIVALKRMGKP
ncbi:MAG: hypothetical protein KJ645_11715 [Planctomycetes bacterium]|nr:hypothetical protein [Planctomycetota bacterium]